MGRYPLPGKEVTLFKKNFPLKKRGDGNITHDTIPSNFYCRRLFFKKKLKKNKIEGNKIFIKEPYPGSGRKYVRIMIDQKIKLYCYEKPKNGKFYGTLYSGTVADWCSQTKSIVISRVNIDYKYTYQYWIYGREYIKYKYLFFFVKFDLKVGEKPTKQITNLN